MKQWMMTIQDPPSLLDYLRLYFMVQREMLYMCLHACVSKRERVYPWLGNVAHALISKPEVLERRCEKCDDNSATCHYRFGSIPPVLVLHTKRFAVCHLKRFSAHIHSLKVFQPTRALLFPCREDKRPAVHTYTIVYRYVASHLYDTHKQKPVFLNSRRLLSLSHTLSLFSYRHGRLRKHWVRRGATRRERQREWECQRRRWRAEARAGREQAIVQEG